MRYILSSKYGVDELAVRFSYLLLRQARLMTYITARLWQALNARLKCDVFNISGR